MVFQNPDGLWFLLGIPLLVLLYFLRPKFQEHSLSSTYLWRRSIAYQNKRMAVTRFRRLLILALQLLLILFGSLLLAQPRLTGIGIGRDVVMILDTSASMRMQTEDGKTVFDLAVNDMLSSANSVRFGSRVTVFTTDSDNCHLLERAESYNEVRRALASAAPAWDGGDPDAAIAAAQEMLRLHPDAQVIYYTDHDIPDVDHVTVRNMASGKAVNAAILSMEDKIGTGGITFTAQVLACGRDMQVTAGLYIDDVLTSARIISLEKDQETAVQWFAAGITSYDTARMVLEEADGLEADNEFILYPQAATGARVAIVSTEPFYLEHAFDAFPGIEHTTYPHAWEVPEAGFDLYVYDRSIPDKLPDGAAVWLIAPTTMPEEIGEITLQDAVPGGYLTRSGDKLSNTRIAALLNGMTNRDTAAETVIGVSISGRYETLLYAGDVPAMVAGFAQDGDPVAVTLFDLHASNLPMQTDYIALVGNIISLAKPPVVDRTWVTVGEEAQAMQLNGCDSIWLIGADGTEQKLTAENGLITFTASMPGRCSLVQESAQGTVNLTRLYARVAEKESDPCLESGESIYLSLPDEPAANAEGEGMDLRLILTALLLILLITECVVYNHERI